LAIKLAGESRARAIASIKRYFAEQMDDHEVGDLKADLLLGFFLQEIAPTVYNRAITDAQSYFQEKTADLEGSCYEPEFGYWQESGKKGDSR
jgi:uncharacterized protein (DUF2164 family)